MPKKFNDKQGAKKSRGLDPMGLLASARALLGFRRQTLFTSSSSKDQHNLNTDTDLPDDFEEEVEEELDKLVTRVKSMSIMQSGGSITLRAMQQAGMQMDVDDYLQDALDDTSWANNAWVKKVATQKEQQAQQRNAAAAKAQSASRPPQYMQPTQSALQQQNQASQLQQQHSIVKPMAISTAAKQSSAPLSSSTSIGPHSSSQTSSVLHTSSSARDDGRLSKAAAGSNNTGNFATVDTDYEDTGVAEGGTPPFSPSALQSPAKAGRRQVARAALSSSHLGSSSMAAGTQQQQGNVNGPPSGGLSAACRTSPDVVAHIARGTRPGFAGGNDASPSLAIGSASMHASRKGTGALGIEVSNTDGGSSRPLNLLRLPSLSPTASHMSPMASQGPNSAGAPDSPSLIRLPASPANAPRFGRRSLVEGVGDPIHNPSQFGPSSGGLSAAAPRSSSPVPPSTGSSTSSTVIGGTVGAARGTGSTLVDGLGFDATAAAASAALLTKYSTGAGLLGGSTGATRAGNGVGRRRSVLV